MAKKVKPPRALPPAKMLDAALAAIRKKLGRPDAAVRLSKGGARSEVREVIPTGIEVLDRWVLGVGGLPIGRTSEWAGAEGVGKTSAGWQFAGACQKLGGVVLYGDAEHSFSEERAALFGCNPETLGLVQGDTLEEFAEAMVVGLSSLDGSVPALVIYDSIGGSTTEAELAGDFSGDAMGKKAGKVAQMVRALNTHALKHRAHVMLVNQIRKKVGVSFGDPTVTMGGDAPKYLASIRVRISGGEQWKEAGATVGKITGFRTYKNRHASPFRSAEARFSFVRGWDDKWATIAHAKDQEFVEADLGCDEGAWEAARKALGWDKPLRAEAP